MKILLKNDYTRST